MVQSRPAKPVARGNLFATTQYHVARGDIGNEKTFFNLSPAKPR